MHTYTYIYLLTFYVLHDHAEVPTGFEGAEHGHDKGILSEGKDVSFHEGLLDLVPQYQVLLVNLLHGKSLTCLQVTHQVHGTDTKTHRGAFFFFTLWPSVLVPEEDVLNAFTHPYAPLLISLMVWKSASPGGFIALILPCGSNQHDINAR